MKATWRVQSRPPAIRMTHARLGMLVDGLSRRRLAKAHELAAMLGVGKSTIFRWAAEGRIPSARMGRTVRFDLVAVLKALDLEAEEVTDGLAEADTRKA